MNSDAQSRGVARLQVIARQLHPVGHFAGRSPDDVVVLSVARTPIGKAKRGAFKDTTPDVLLAHALSAAVARAGVRPEDVGDIRVGNVLPAQGAVLARMAQFQAGFPYSVPIATVNRQCSSGLQAVADIAAAIRAGHIDVGIAAGVESMSASAMGESLPPFSQEAVFASPLAADCLVPMGMTSETIAEKYGISRAEQDAFAVRSHALAAQAQREGRFRAEIVPVKLADGSVVDMDEGVREGTSVEGLAKLRAAFKEGGTTTAGNSSQVSDGAAAIVLASRQAAERLGLSSNIIGVFRGYAVAGVPPSEMGIGPAFAIPAALTKAGVGKEHVGVFEINEAFASQALYCVRQLGLDPSKVNPNGGAIALGHPLGCTGARQVATLLREMARTGERFGVVSMCIGTGMGPAAVFERA